MGIKFESRVKNKQMSKKYRKLLLLIIITLIFVILFIIINGELLVKSDVDGGERSNGSGYSIEKSGKSSEIFSLEADQYLILVNKENKLKKNYEPDDLVIPSIRFNSVNNMVQHVRTDVAKELQIMFATAKNDGINLIAISGYRSYEYQQVVYNESLMSVGEEETRKFVALPGTSEHQTGLAMDVLSSEYYTLDEGFENTEAFRWLKEHISEYGFIIRYPRGKEDITGYEYEPWHLRYVGIEAAIEINERGLTLEEYLEENNY